MVIYYVTNIYNSLERIDRMKRLYKKIKLERLLFIVMPITMFLFLCIQNRRLKGLTLIIGTVLFVLGRHCASLRNKL